MSLRTIYAALVPSRTLALLLLQLKAAPAREMDHCPERRESGLPLAVAPGDE